MSQSYARYKELKRKIADLDNVVAVLRWDQEVYMPQEGAGFRSQQIATISGISHEMSTSNEMVDVLQELNTTDNLSFLEKTNVKESLRILDKSRKLSKEFIEKQSRTTSETYQAWMKARQENDYKIYIPKLEETVTLQRERASLVGYEKHPYDALMDDYEPGLTTDRVEEVFIEVKKGLKEFFARIKGQPQPDQSMFNGHFDKDKQMAFSKKLIEELGFSWQTGRLDLSEHPFTTSFSAKDARITTRITEDDIRESIWGSIHEAGHAFYELGLPESEYGLPSGQPISLSIHESQSRFWENNIGKSNAFIEGYWPVFQQYFPEAFGKIQSNTFFKSLNTVTPDLIRINSDEVTYHFHILLRFEIEKGIIDGSFKVADLEEIWNAKIKEYLDLDVPSARQGVLQDIHWSHGSFGYFPTYSLGSFYAAQFYNTIAKTIPDIEEQVRKGHFSEILQWLRDNIHKHGHLYSSEELCEKVTGEKLNYAHFNDYLYNKYSKVYSL